MRIRINNIECRFNQLRYEIVRWQPNHYYGKREHYLSEGWVENNGFMCKDNISVDLSFFSKEETCCVIATLKYDYDEGCCDLNSVGSRLLDLDKSERSDFFSVYEYAEDRIRESELKDE